MSDKHQYQVRKVGPCPKCQGAGVYTHPAWARYWMESKCAAGCLDAVEFFRRQGFERPPAEEVPCDRCSGEGQLASFVPFQAAMAEWEDHRKIRLHNLLRGLVAVLAELGLDDREIARRVHLVLAPAGEGGSP